MYYSIRVPEDAGVVDCSRCGQRFTASGPCGYAGDELICDMCLLDNAHELGMLMALVFAARSFGVLEDSSAGEYWSALAEVGAFLRIYEKFAAKSGPLRFFKIVPLGVGDGCSPGTGAPETPSANPNAAAGDENDWKPN